MPNDLQVIFSHNSVFFQIKPSVRFLENKALLKIKLPKMFFSKSKAMKRILISKQTNFNAKPKIEILNGIYIRIIRLQMRPQTVFGPIVCRCTVERYM